ncbi:PKD domain-containing protein [Pontibacter sp. G13]|uniref:PKD domain-containing protein n=1 Tax=Pontibacter sp. G13 TaxID=3074898 RepID=UPI00288C514A|nr:PKD domain-containing protein [Pontibacter sp. G13]WNJ21125.1 PKD domain-containing protein [Pontibacter sp. G13]
MKQFVLIITFLIPCISYAQIFPHLMSQRFIDNAGEDEAKRLLIAPDGNLLMGGITIAPDSLDNHCGNIWIVKADTTGDVIWDQEINMQGCEEIRDMVATEDGGVIFTGVTTTMMDHEEKGNRWFWGDFFVGKLDHTGAIDWLKSYGGSDLDQANGIAKGHYGDFMVVGGTHSRDGHVSNNHGMSDIWIQRIDPDGESQFDLVVGGSKHDWANSISVCQNGDFLIAGYTNSGDFTDQKAGLYGNGCIMRITQSGYIVWKRTYACPKGGYFTDVSEDKDGTIMVVGTYQSETDLTADFWWMKLNSRGVMIQQKVYSGPENEYLVSHARCENGYIMAGYSTAVSGTGFYSKGGDDFWLTRTDEQGNILWRKTYGGRHYERCADVVEYRPGVYYALGDKENRFTRSENHDKDFWLLKIQEFPEDSMSAGIFVRAKNYRVNRDTPTRFRAECDYCERFLWDFGDGTTSTERDPLKTYKLSGAYEVRLTIFVNEHCRETVTLQKELEVW